MNRALIITALAVSGCFSPSDQLDVPEPNDGESLSTSQVRDEPTQTAPEIPVGGCDMTKFLFSQDTGCANDGWVEFCAAKSGGAPAITELRAIAANLSITEGSIGNAGCDEKADYLVLYKLDTSTECLSQHGAMTSTAWSKMCAMSAVPATRHFVPGWGE